MNKHIEGDIWEEFGKKWTIKNGLKQSVNVRDEFRQQSILPLICPECNTQMKKRLDSKFYNLYNRCFDCTVKYETDLKIHNKYKDYEKEKMRNNINSWLLDLETVLNEIIESQDVQYHTEQGDVEKWSGGEIDKEELRKLSKEQLEQVKEKLLTDLENL